ncbi:unnamed protein product [Linum trigynum]|uniref:Ionotropic glutamate receptor C-terminal domain-containing protein n=1 Tax=Linum trigynum TaxID=586398 RepID=A0AAV2CA55_9ROSI
MQANFLIQQREKASITSFSKLSPTVASMDSPYYFGGATQRDSTQVNATAAIAKSVGRQQCIPINVDNAFRQCTVPSSVNSLQAVDACIPHRSAIFHSSYGVVYVNGNGARVAGFWTPGKMPAKELMKSSTSVTNSTSWESRRTAVWKGDRAMAPNGKKLRIGVPVRDGFSEFASSVTTDPETNKTNVIIGYSIDIFEAIVQTLPYALPLDYDDLLYQVFSRHLDDVVGDTEIIAKRSTYVDHNTESGVSMVVPPVKPNGSKNPWLFLKPLTSNLWLIVFFLLLFIGFVVWVFEHRMISEDFRGSPSHEAGTSIRLSLSTMVFAHRENVASNLARTVVIILCFVVLIMTMSYTASLTSLRTMEGLQPTVAVLNVAERDKISKVEARIGKKRWWLEESSTSVYSKNQLGLSNFWGLLLITGVATVSSLCIFAAVSIYKHRKLLVPEEDDSQSNPSFWRRILNPFTICYKINPTCHTSRDDRVGTEVHLANMNAITPSTFPVRMDFSMDTPQSPTPLIESLWIQPTDLLR